LEVEVTMCDEEFRPVVGYEGHYQVSDQGRVRSLKRGKVMAQMKNRRGYLQINLYWEGRAKNYLVHRLVAQAFLGRIPLAWQVNHKDGVKTNNKLDNLEVVTAEANRAHAREKGLFRPKHGEENFNAKLTEEDVRTIRRLWQEKVSALEISFRYRMSQRAIYSVIKRETWRHVA
jgi:HNH endonuclease/NUMOD4 motif